MEKPKDNLKISVSEKIEIDTRDNPLGYVEEHGRKYQKKIWISKGCRFVAHRRLSARNQASQLVVSFFSVGVIAASVGLLILGPEQKALSDLVTVLAINASVFILVLSNLEFARNYAVEAERMLRGAQVLSKIHDELEYLIKLKDINETKLISIIDHYNQVLMDFEANHEDIDYIYFQSMHPKHFEKGINGIIANKLTAIRYYWHIWGFYISSIVIPPASIILAMKYFPLLVTN